jgi:hypothetical protein
LIEFSIDKYKLAVHIDEEPVIFDLLLKHAKYKDIEGLKNEGTSIYILVGTDKEWYEQIIAFRFDPIDYGGFNPGFLIVPETDTLFIGAGTLIKTYNLLTGQKIFEKEFACGFWNWRRHGEQIIMSEELEYGVFTLDGNEIWTTFVEPPWSYEIEGDHVKLDVMDKISLLDKWTGEQVK